MVEIWALAKICMKDSLSISLGSPPPSLSLPVSPLLSLSLPSWFTQALTPLPFLSLK